jgi:TonB-linked SusC/RagA family outer membrane protein
MKKKKKNFLKSKKGMKNCLLWMMCTIFLSTGFGANAQNRQLTGTVTDAVSEEPLAGVSIVVKGTSRGTTTNVEGNFTLEVTTGTVLEFSYISYLKQEVAIGNETSLQIRLKEDVEQLDEVIVTAYGPVIKRKIANAVTNIDLGQIEDLGAYTNISSALQGRASGVFISNSSGIPGATPSISIRGSDAPMYLIDGIIQDGGAFNRLNSQDIESISIMKDAASAAVYGALAGNGIIVVKTKSGRIGKARISYTYDHQFTQPVKQKHNISSYELATVRNYLDDVYGNNHTYPEEALQAYLTGSDPVNYPDVNWREAIMRSVAQSERHSLTSDWGNEDTQYRISIGYYNQGSLIKPVAGEEVLKYQTANIAANVTHHFRPIGLKVVLDLKNSFLWTKGKNEGEIMRRVKQLPTDKIYNTDGTYFANTPFLYLDPGNGYDKVSEPVMNNRLDLEWDVYGVKGLKAFFTGNYKTTNYNKKSWNSAYVPSYRADGSVQPATSKPSLSMEKTSFWSYELKTGLQYQNTFAEKHTLGLSAFYSQMESYSEKLTGSRKEYLTSSVDQIFAGPEEGMSNGGSSTEMGRLGYVGVLSYDFMGRYILGASLRIDGSDNYSEGNRYGYFPSLSGAYVISDEPFIRPLADKLKIDMFKIRTSWGKTGIDGSRFAYYSNWSIGSAAFDIAGNRAPSVNTPGLVSPDLTWYSTRSINVGIDISMFQNRLSATFDYFVQNTKGYLRAPNDIYKTPLGTSLPTVMSDDVFRRAGSEITVRWKDSHAGLTYDLGMNLSFYDEIWAYKNEDPTTAANPLISGTNKTLSDGTRTWIANGLYQDVNDLLNNPHALWTSNVKTGDIRYVDVNGDGRIDTDGTWSDDKVFNKMTKKPILQYGFDFNLGYNGFFLCGLVQGAGKNYKIIGSSEGMPVGFNRIQYKEDLDYWTPQNPDARYPIPDRGSGLANNYQKESTYWAIDCKYIRLKTLQVGYNFKNINRISNLTLSLVGQNLITVSNALDYNLDPEQGEITGYGYPITKTYSLVLNIGF